MPDDEAGTATDSDEPVSDERVFTGYGIASAVAGVVAVAAVVLGLMIWSGHRGEVDERDHQSRVLRAAAEWTSILINLNKDSVASGMQQLHEGTVGDLNAEFDTAVEPYRQLVEKLQSRTVGQIDSVSIESIFHAPPGPNGAPAPPRQQQPELAVSSSRTDTVLVVATSVSENAGQGEPQTVRWNMRVDVSDVDGKLLISRLEPIR